jgi:TRAP transporter TAXI family solute receptor
MHYGLGRERGYRVTEDDDRSPAAGSRTEGSIGEAVRQWGLLGAGFAAVAVVVGVVLALLASTIHPAPPRHLRMATGAAGGFYFSSGEALRAKLATYGVDLELVPSSGSAENVSLLDRADGGVDAAIVQGGVGIDEADAGALQSVGGFFYEPLWLFTRRSADAKGFDQDLLGLRGRRVAVGPEGSGVRALAALLLQENGLAGEALTLSPLGGIDAAHALERGEVDAVIFVTSPTTGYVHELLENPAVQLVDFARAPAYARRHPFLSAVTLPRGVVDLGKDAPSQDVTLIAPAASIVVRKDLHPAIQSLLIQAGSEVFRRGDVVSAPGTFPSRDLVSFPLSSEAARYYTRGGPTFLRRYLPFWAANLVERLWVLVIPAATLLYPLVKSAPPIYRWRIKRRILRWYRELRRLEEEGREAAGPTAVSDVRARLRRLLHEVGGIKIPLDYTDDVYRLRTHIRLVYDLITEMGQPAAV